MRNILSDLITPNLVFIKTAFTLQEYLSFNNKPIRFPF